jgi:transcriptional regulator with XRE-family HTH domain
VLKDGMKLRLREIRKLRGLTLEQLGDMVGMSISYLSEIESGKKLPNSKRIERFCEALSVKPYELLRSDEEFDLTKHIIVLESLSPEARDAVLMHAIGLVAAQDEQ